MDMKLEQCTKFFKENKGSLSTEQTEIAIGIMDYKINLYNDWNLEYGSYLFASSCNEVSQDEKNRFAGKEAAFNCVSEALHNHLAEYTLSLQREIEEKNNSK